MDDTRFAALTALALLIAVPSAASAQDRPRAPTAPARAPKAPAKAPPKVAPRAPAPRPAPSPEAAPGGEVEPPAEEAPVEVEPAAKEAPDTIPADENAAPSTPSAELESVSEKDADSTASRASEDTPEPPAEAVEAREAVEAAPVTEPPAVARVEPVDEDWTVELRLGVDPDDEEGERPWSEGEPVPYGWELDSHVNKGLVIAGAVTFGVTWLGSAAWAAHRIQEKEGDDFFERVGEEDDVKWPRDAALFIPLAGPWIALDAAESGRDRVIMIADGVLQAGGLAMLIAGAVAKETVIVRTEDEETEVSFVPMASPGAAGATFVGTF